jgi:hypothetical protein
MPPVIKNLDFETIKNSIDTKMEDLKEGIEV